MTLFVDVKGFAGINYLNMKFRALCTNDHLIRSSDNVGHGYICVPWEVVNPTSRAAVQAYIIGRLPLITQNGPESNPST